MGAKLLQLCPTLCDPMDYSLPGFSVHGICQERVLEWGSIALAILFFNFSLTHIVFPYLKFHA